MNVKIDWNLVAKYAAGECSDEEIAQLRSWARKDPARQERLERLVRIWQAAEAPETPWNAKRAWMRVEQELGKDKDAASGSPARLRPSPSRERLRRRGRVNGNQVLQREGASQRQAARGPKERSPLRRVRHHRFRLVVLAAVVLAVLVALFAEGVVPFGPSGEKVFATQKGQQAAFELVDGTQVRLNVDSRLEVLRQFSSVGERVVRLDGEAYFDVAGDSERPFIVHTPAGAEVEVVGTAFIVQAYRENDLVEVAVAEGEVALRPRSGRDQEQAAVRLRSGSIGMVVGERLEPVIEGVDLSGRLGWLDGRLVFENAPFEQVVRRLERWFDVHIETQVLPEEVVALNAVFEDEPLEEVLYDISVALNLHYEREQNVIVFRPAEAPGK